MTDKPSPNFRRLVKGALNQEILVPLVRAYLNSPTFKTVHLPIDGFDQRYPDNWFHPSEHPTWPARMLFYYLTEPEMLIREPPDPIFVFAVTQGKFWHKLLQHILLDVDALIPNPDNPEDPSEWFFADESLRSRGSIDGLTNPDKLPIPEPEVFEYKTMDRQKISGMPQGPPDSPEVLEWFYDRCFDYVLQGQNYMLISGYRRWRGFIMSPQVPFIMREVVMPYDMKIATGIRDLYRGVLEAVEAGAPPHNCCAPRSKESKACPARAVCPVAAM